MSETPGHAGPDAPARSQNRNPNQLSAEKKPEEIYRDAVADALRRGLPQLEPLLRSLEDSTAALRRADWNDSVGPRAWRSNTEAAG